ncbi:hypothetical protein EDB84DRAFT_1677547 [Lactarius hengduanensis]|nr:hypothetical protein EDB84DRAFT_1677547 [Lactarius hengduanensis]
MRETSWRQDWPHQLEKKSPSLLALTFERWGSAIVVNEGNEGGFVLSPVEPSNEDMVYLGKPDVDPSSEQDMSDTSTLPEKEEDYGSVPPKIRDARTNYLCVSKKGVAIEEQYFIDLSIPPPALHILSGAKNLSLYTTSGAVTADVWVTGNNRLKRVSLKLSSDNGHVCAKLKSLKKKKRTQHDIFYNGESEHRPSLDIELWANYGDVSISLPRCFRGPIMIRSHHERIAFSSELKKRTPKLSESDVDGVRGAGRRSEEGGKDAERIGGRTPGRAIRGRAAHERADQVGRRTRAASDETERVGELLYGQCEILHERSGKLITIMSGTGARAPHYDSRGVACTEINKKLGWSIRASSERKTNSRGPRQTARFRTSSSRERLFVSTSYSRTETKAQGARNRRKIRRNLDPQSTSNMRETSWHPDRSH